MEDKQKRITVSLTEECYEALRKYAFDANQSLSSAAKHLCEEGLQLHEYGVLEGNTFVRTENK